MDLSYRIDYSPNPRFRSFEGLFSGILMTCVFFLCFLVLVSLFWPEGREVLQLLLIPGEPENTMEAAETFALELACGNRFSGVVSDFIQKVTGHACYP